MAGNRIMVVDGSSVSREIVTRILSNVIKGALITPCASGQDALDTLANGQFDLITTSLLLPDQDGLELCRTIRQLKLHHTTPIIVISGDADTRMLREGFNSGVTDYFDKSQGYPAFGEFIKAFSQRNSGLVGRILFVEDSLTAATITRRMLERHGLKITHVTSAEEALKHVQAMYQGEVTYDIVITDFYLENDMTGGDLLHAIRSRYQFTRQELPVLLITGKDDMQIQVDTFHAGASDFVNKPLVEEILMARVRSQLLIKHQYDALQHLNNNIEQVASTDALTGVRNRRYLLEHGPRLLATAESEQFWAMIIDIDHIKQVNTHHGHLVGDHLLASLGKILREHFPEAMVVRFGGEEFAILLPNTPHQQALARAERLRQQVEQLKPEGITVTISIGMACSSSLANADLNLLLGLADKALAAAKEAGRNRLFISDSQGCLKAPRFQHNG